MRPALEYRHGHIPIARSIPIGAPKIRLAELPRDRAVVAYCRGPYGAYSDEAAEVLWRHECVRRLGEGFPDWPAAGLPVEAGIAT